MNLFKFFGKKRPASQGFRLKKTPTKPQLQAFILEPILTPSGLFDGGDDGSDTLLLDLDTHPLPDIDPVDISHDASDSLPDDTGIHTLSHDDLSDPISLDSIPVQDIEPISFIYPDTPVGDVSGADLTHPVVEDLGVHTLDETIPDHNNQSLDLITPDDHTTIEVETLVSGTELTTDPPTFTFDSGVFTVGETGEVSVDYLFDGGKYQGELAIFSLDGMEHLEPGSHEFIQEAAHRALSDSPLGHVVISDRIEGARFSGILPHEQNWNVGDYHGVKTVEMNPGDEFGIMLVPNSTVQKLFDNPDAGGAVRPLFSMVTANPEDAFHVGQIADVNGQGHTFVMEDLRVDTGSDHDYNDIIFQVHGATGQAVQMDDVIAPAHDWRESQLGGNLMEFIKPPENQPLIGVIDTGLSANNPDIDPFHVHFGAHSDYVAEDGLPLLQPTEGSEHGTHITGIIAATQDNGIGIDAINDQAPIYIARATGSGQWAEALKDFVDAAKDSGQPNAIANLSLDLTQVNHDGSITTRYEFTPAERAALEYARQNHVLIVTAAGNDGDVMSVLGQASQEFDNIITVGAAKPIDLPTLSSDVPISSNVPHDDLTLVNTSINLLTNSSSEAAEAFERADYSSYGYGLDILAPGGTIENPVVSTVGNGVGTMAGTSVATAKVTGAASQVWAANPQLSYRQVIEILKSTATDLKAPGWDMETGAGLLNMVAAVELARTTTPTSYSPEPFSTPDTWGSAGKVIPMERAVDVPIWPNDEPTWFPGRVMSRSGVNVRSGPGTNYSIVGGRSYNTFVDFDRWTYGERITDIALGTPDERWYRIAGTKNQWIASAIIDGNAPGSTPLPPTPTDSGSSRPEWEVEIDKKYATIQSQPVAAGGAYINIGEPIGGYLDAAPSPYGTTGKWRRYQVPGANPQDGGCIHWSPQYGAVAMWYGFNLKYQEYGGSGGRLGFPIRGEYDYIYGGYEGRRLDFEGGWMFWSPATSDLVFFNEETSPVPEPFYSVYLQYKPTLGNPQSGVESHASGAKYQLFDNGSIVSSQYGTFPLYGAIRQTYLNTGGLNGWLGAPKSAEIGQGNGTVVQYFANGYIIWNGSRATAYRTGDGQPNIQPPDNTPIPDGNSSPPGNGQRIIDAVNKVNPDQAYYQEHDITGDGIKETFCNWFAADVLEQMGIKLPPNGDQIMDKPHPIYGKQDHSKPIGADQLYNFFQRGGNGKWQGVNATDAAAKANNGQAVVASSNGHIAIVIPGSSASDVRIAQAGKRNGKNMRVNDGFGREYFEYFVYTG